MRNSVPAVCASPPKRVTPPNSHSVTSDTGMPARRATTACISSCASRDASSTTAPIAPATQYVSAERPGALLGRVLARLQVNNHRITKTLQWTPRRKPATVPRRMCSLTINLQILCNPVKFAPQRWNPFGASDCGQQSPVCGMRALPRR
jgi:hypothetical protein